MRCLVLTRFYAEGTSAERVAVAHNLERRTLARFPRLRSATRQETARRDAPL
jgi:hypothetical protein